MTNANWSERQNPFAWPTEKMKEMSKFIVLNILSLFFCVFCSCKSTLKSSNHRTYLGTDYFKDINDKRFEVLRKYQYTEYHLGLAFSSDVCLMTRVKKFEDTLKSNNFQYCWSFDIKDTLPKVITKFVSPESWKTELFFSDSFTCVEFPYSINGFLLCFPNTNNPDTISFVNGLNKDGSFFKIEKTSNSSSMENVEKIMLDSFYVDSMGDIIAIILIEFGGESTMHSSQKKIWVSNQFGIIKSIYFENNEITDSMYLDCIIRYKKHFGQYKFHDERIISNPRQEE